MRNHAVKMRRHIGAAAVVVAAALGLAFSSRTAPTFTPVELSVSEQPASAPAEWIATAGPGGTGTGGTASSSVGSTSSGSGTIGAASASGIAGAMPETSDEVAAAVFDTVANR